MTELFILCALQMTQKSKILVNAKVANLVKKLFPICFGIYHFTPLLLLSSTGIFQNMSVEIIQG
jgi:hypothetical protein